jgi:hypothetical protein
MSGAAGGKPEGELIDSICGSPFLGHGGIEATGTIVSKFFVPERKGVFPVVEPS